jgi:choline dehydrogenase-like flavoprotein
MLPNPARLLEREVPWRKLEDALGSARAGRGSVASLEGEAGIGKTTLALSFAEIHRPDARVYIGACEHLATPEPVGPLRDIERDSQGRFSVSATSLLATYEALLKLLTGLGTYRMGNDPRTSIVDRYHRTHDIRNLFVCDGSSLVTSGRGQPTMTVQALAFRAADHIAQFARAGDI